jgi:ABC-type Fe3+-hydroxamate transport system substrate-binding protein
MIFFQGEIENIERQYSKIISVVPSQTELLFDLGLNDEVIGITKFCVHPEQWFRTKTRIGGTKKLDIEKIRSLQPDLVIANKEENLESEINAISAFTDVYVSDIETLDDALVMINEVGRLTNKIQKAELINNNIRKAFTELRPLKNISAAYLIWQNPYMTIGKDTFIHDMMQRCGFENIFAEQDRYPEITAEQLNAAEIILLSSEPFPFKQKHIDKLKTHYPAKKIILVDGEMFSWYGSRLLKAPEYFKNLTSEVFGL